MKKILVTGGCGYIGAHTILDLIENNFDPVCIDNNSRSTTALLQGIKDITGKAVKNYKVDLCNFDDTYAVFQENTDIEGIIHFAAYKAVGESVENPLLYFENNLTSLINVLKCAKEFNISNFIFSSSCTVYGSPDEIPVTERSPLKPAESPYGATKQMGEEIVKEVTRSSETSSILLRYFNPVGAHPSALIGELPVGKPQNLVPAITQTAIGKLKQLIVHGDDYETRDGSCVRDYIHVCDIAHAHTLALQYLINKKNSSPCEIFNLGTGNGVTVLEAIHSFEKVSGVKLNYAIGPRRPGDIMAIYANNSLAKEKLNWNPKYSLDEMMSSAWKWELKLKADEQLHNNPNFQMN
ncbi:UDP-glucose 4-epimerase GalE [Ginsengibacter hankyongi]|uniref:UDP-glucose 4-epimerase n=1 Tax=Ginsengibacter hankyongi TaxID=2607284 RepID=A0A5J5IGP9_9BACT|nr:UDP-glucose 4-epimerase GalE [Ginsengibacter hankyongi]KAA9039460.1 UDP-glucose 4-epimerase GalE [Ginsengibacter hankyongi]